MYGITHSASCSQMLDVSAQDAHLGSVIIMTTLSQSQERCARPLQIQFLYFLQQLSSVWQLRMRSMLFTAICEYIVTVKVMNQAYAAPWVYIGKQEG